MGSRGRTSLRGHLAVFGGKGLLSGEATKNSAKPKTWPRWEGDPLSEANLREVAPNLWVGSEYAAPAKRWVLIVDLVASSKRHGWYPKNVPILSTHFSDGDPFPGGFLRTAYPQVVSAMKRGPVLVHCVAGLSRSTSMAYAVMRKRWGLSHEEALHRVQVPGFKGKPGDSGVYPLRRTLRSAQRWAARG